MGHGGVRTEADERDETTLVIRASTYDARMSIRATGFFFFAIACAFFAWRTASAFNEVVLAIGAILFGTASFVHWRQTRRIGKDVPALTLTRSGFSVNMHWFPPGELQWNEVDGFVLMMGHIGVQLRDPGAYRRARTSLGRWSDRVNIRCFGTPFIIDASLFDGGRDAVLSALTVWHERYSSVEAPVDG